ncbi:riboflavin biosynthesis protein RibD [Niveispirillum lacus]|uniref:Riboflavin biosynthesis protein RibD n=2 Tax=Niveispirillum lacus TaxID=1981099 RepID=A0A255YRE6_9PROT|nr:bifunctional diaminohydroxyphosphoribosylaminopyrimidine deaminase/5-amino-6-(5-phosphoribosylamino)uracil reductase RibD [Niveispirillum lacus]OYQ31783.1 riboflavin biosynthesis protein RibD [Niveispirillum lacus]
MQAALRLARRHLGRVWPNPSVGCILVKDGVVLGRGVTAPGGRPHGEPQALAQAGEAARGATVYVSLEPCNHHGKTPPCSEALIAAGVARIVVACEDPDPRVSGGGIRRLREAGIQVDVGLCAMDAMAVNAGFFSRILKGRPGVTLKLATSLDGRVATATGHSQWITGPDSRARGHLLRAHHDAILIGIGTALADDPELTCRLPGLAGANPVRVVLDSHLRLPLTAKLVRGAATIAPTWVVTLTGADSAKAAALDAAAVRVLRVDADKDGRLPVQGALTALAGQGITRLLVEGGPTVATAFLKAGVVDQVEWFRAPLLIGGDGLPAVGHLDVDLLAQALRLSPAGDVLNSHQILR